MRSVLETQGQGYNFYHARRPEYATGSNIPFRVSPEPLKLSMPQKDEVRRIGHDVADFMHAVDELYHNDSDVRGLLNRGKPEIFCVDRPSHYLFLRPDLIVYGDSFTLCEVETSPFGLGLAQLINRAYNGEGFDTMVPPQVLDEHIRSHSPSWPTRCLVDRVVTGTQPLLTRNTSTGKSIEDFT